MPAPAKSGTPKVLGAVVAAALLVGTISACTSAPTTTPTPGTVTTTVPTADPTQTAGTPTVASSSPSAAPSSPQVENSYTPPTKTPGRPDASTAGRLTATSLPNPVLGFRGRVVDPEEGEYNPNGTWVHAIDGTQAAYESLPQCVGVRLADIAKPVAALSGTYRDKANRSGNALGLQFADETEATAFFGLYADQLRACAAAGADAPVVVTDLAVTDTTITGRRTYPGPEKWSEMIKRSGVVVVLVILADGHQASPGTLARTAAGF